MRELPVKIVFMRKDGEDLTPEQQQLILSQLNAGEFPTAVPLKIDGEGVATAAVYLSFLVDDNR